MGVSYIYAPNVILAINAWVRKILFNDARVIYYRKKIGLLHVFISLLIFYAVFNLHLPDLKIFNKQIVRNRLFQAYTQFYTGKYDDSIKLSEEILSKDPNNLRATELLARSYFCKGDYIKSKLYCSKILKNFPDNKRISDLLEKQKEATPVIERSKKGEYKR